MAASKTVAQVAAEEQRLLKDIKSTKTAAGESALKTLFKLAEDHAEVGVPVLDASDGTLRARREHLKRVKLEIERLQGKRRNGAPVGGRIVELEDERDGLIRSIRKREDEILAR